MWSFVLNDAARRRFVYDAKRNSPNMKLASLFRHFVTAALLGGCSVRAGSIKGDGNIQTEHRQISDFSVLDAVGAYEVQWSSGAPSLTITADQNLLSNIHSEVSGDTLKIHSEDSLAPTRGIKIVIQSSALARVNLAGAITLTAQRVAAASLAIASAGASTINVDGSVTSLSVELTGASRLNASGLSAKSVDVSLMGASSADVAVKETLKTTITGAGSLTYSGQPATLEKQITGAGSIHHK